MTTGKRIILTTFGSYGDVHPYMAIALEFLKRGHHPVIATSELYREKMQASGFEFIPVRPNIPPPEEQDAEMMEKVMEPRTGSKFLLDEMLIPALREGYDDLLQAVQGADLLFTHPITFAGPLVAQKTGIPWVSGVLAPGLVLFGLRSTGAAVLAMDEAHSDLWAARGYCFLQARDEDVFE